MLLSDFQKYKDHYKPGAKKISLRVSRPKLTKEENPVLKMEMCLDNFDLFFNRKGVLLTSIHFGHRSASKIEYSYNTSEKLVCAIKFNFFNNQLIELSEFEYDELDRIVEQSCKMVFETGSEPLVYFQNHEYGINTEIISMTSNDIDAHDHVIYETYDENKNLIESKIIHNEDELVYWLKWEYDLNGEILEELSLDENGETIVYEGDYIRNIIEVKEYAREMSQSKSVINEVKLRNGEPAYYYEEAIEYYEKG